MTLGCRSHCGQKTRPSATPRYHSTKSSCTDVKTRDSKYALHVYLTVCLSPIISDSCQHRHTKYLWLTGIEHEAVIGCKSVSQSFPAASLLYWLAPFLPWSVASSFYYSGNGQYRIQKNIYIRPCIRSCTHIATMAVKGLMILAVI